MANTFFASISYVMTFAIKEAWYVDKRQLSLYWPSVVHRKHVVLVHLIIYAAEIFSIIDSFTYIYVSVLLSEHVNNKEPYPHYRSL